jgi:ParB family transcriptional regulator, chromosome partitioning protein
MAKKRISDLIEDDFNSTVAMKERHDTIEKLKQQLKSSQQEVEQREQLLKELRSQLEQHNGKIVVSIDRIIPSDQCRKTFPEAVILKRVESLRQEGQLDPLILIPSTEKPNHYQLEDGEVTWRAANYLVQAGENKWRNIEAVLSTLTGNEREIHRRSLLHHLHSESLNTLDRAESLIRELNWSLNLETDEIKKLLRNLDYEFRKNSEAKLILQQIDKSSKEEQQKDLQGLNLNESQIAVILELFAFQIELHSFVANDLPTIDLSEDLKQAIRQKELGCHQAKTLNKLNCKNLNEDETTTAKIRAKAIETVLENQLSVKDARNLVSEILKQHQTEKPQSITKAKTNRQYQAIKQNLKVPLKRLQPNQLQSLKELMTQKLAEIESILEK